MRLLLLLVLAVSASAQRNSGEIRIYAMDDSGGALQAEGILTGQASDVRRAFTTDSTGKFTLRVLPWGLYRMELTRQGFSPSTTLVDVHGEHPVEVRMTLGVAPIETALVVRDSDTLLDPNRTSFIQNIGEETIRHRAATAPGRSVLELVNSQPGWLLEANGVLHPRGSEYQVQYVIDGMPLLDNRSPAFAQTLGVEEFQSMNVRTGGYPAEYGRKLGGVIEVSTEADRRPGWHGKLDLQRSSFDTSSGYGSAQYGTGATTFGVSAEGMMTNRYLDAPVEENYTNHGSGSGLSGRIDHDWSDKDRTRAYVHHRRSRFLVPNELLQQSAGQRQDRTAGETLGYLSHQHIFSPRVVGNIREMARDTGADLWANSLSTPILPSQDRSFRENYLGASLSANFGRHAWKAGADAIFGSVRENFAYRITAYRLNPGNVQIFDPDVPQTFQFQDRRQSREQAAYVQDLWRLGNWTVSAGLRFDHYRLVSNESAWSPRLGVAYYLPSLRLVLRASYDRTFETPAVENLLLGSSNLLREFGGEGAFLPLKAGRGNYYEAGFAKAIGSHVRLDASWYKRQINNFADDSLLLNTGVSFPIAFSKGEVHGYEAKLAVPRWGRFSGFASYSNLTGHGFTPVSGGLFLGDDAEELLNSGRFPITQDQRNTVRSRVRWQAHSRVWVAASGRYNSGLPVEIEGSFDEEFIRRQYGEAILAKVDFERGRVRPSSSIDISAGVDLLQRDRHSVRIVGDVLNLANRLNVINFAGVLSGTAIEPSRSFAIRLQTDF